MGKPRLLVFASGTPHGGGSGFKALAEARKLGRLDADIIGVVSHNPNGGVHATAREFSIPFFYLPHPNSPQAYRNVLEAFRERKAPHGPDFIALSGWLKPVFGLKASKTFNIHPGPLPRFGGKGMYGKHVHEAVLKAYRRGELKHSMVTMHFVTEEYDQGPIFFEKPVPILPEDTVETLGKRVSEAEHCWQPVVTDMVVNGEISWNPQDPKNPIGRIFPDEQ